MANQPGDYARGDACFSENLIRWQDGESLSVLEKLRRQAELLEQSGDAIFVWQLDGPIVYWSRGAEQLYGYPRDQAMGRPGRDLLQTLHPLSFDHLLEVLARSGRWRGELQQRTADGQQVLVDAALSVLPYQPGPKYVLQTDRDITLRKQTEEQLQGENQALEQQVSQLTIQLRAMAAELARAEQRERQRLGQRLHDQLQELLASPQFTADLLASQTHDEHLHRFLQQVDQLLDQSLDTSRSLAAQLSPPIVQRGSLDQILHWLGRWMYEKHGLVVQVSADEQVPAPVPEVRSVLFHAVRELLLNVVKHAGTRQARLIAVPAPVGAVRITVADDGLGFDPRIAEGASAGLASIGQALEQLGGHMEIRSAPGEGTRVTLLAPAHAPREQPAPAPETVPVAPVETIASPGTSRIRVLLADDHAVVRDGLRRLLQMQPDIEVVAQAADGLEAVELAVQVRPDVIVLDANMPRLNGIQAARRIHEELPDVKIIGLSMYSAADMDLAMRQAGACEYLTKSSSPETVVEAVRNSMTSRSPR